MTAPESAESKGLLQNALSSAAVLLCLLAMGPILVWLHAFTYGGATWDERVKTFASFFPSWLLGNWAAWRHGPPRLVVFQIAFAAMAFLLAMMEIMDTERPSIGRRLLHLVVLLLSFVTILVLLWSSFI